MAPYQALHRFETALPNRAAAEDFAHTLRSVGTRDPGVVFKVTIHTRPGYLGADHGVQWLSEAQDPIRARIYLSDELQAFGAYSYASLVDFAHGDRATRALGQMELQLAVPGLSAAMEGGA
jgi:hypothetical protein